MKVTGYSERGAVNALFYELAYSGNALHLLEQFLALADFPVHKQLGTGLTDAHVLIEQSLSDFGDADAILLLDAGEAKAAIFIEAKVKPSQKVEWTLDREFTNFEKGCHSDKELSSSNLFTQLYHKSRFIDGLRSGGIHALQSGIGFPECSKKRVRKIGNNPVVLSAVKAIEPYRENAWYFSLVPDKPSSVRSFFNRFSSIAWPLDSSGVDASRWGGLTWEQVAEFCNNFNLKSTNWVLEFNKGQIY